MPFEPVSPELRARLRALCTARLDFASRLGQFYSLEAFRLHDYRKVVFYDSDVLFRAPIDALFEASEPLLCCGDDVYLRGWRRDAATFAPLPPGHPPGAAGALDRPFGAGFLLIDEQVIAADCYADLLSLVTPETWRGTATPHADQLILNRYFAGRQTLVSAAYDFVLPFAEAIRTREGVAASSAKVPHFAGPVVARAHGRERWFPSLLWASEPRWRALFADPSHYDWPRTRKAWYFHARAHALDASVFVTKSTQHVLHVEQLVRHFRNAKFLFMVRNPYAVCEGICRRYRTRLGARYQRPFVVPGRSLPAAAATHVIHCLAWQRHNVETYRDRGVFFTYETMCADPAVVERKIETLVPELDDLLLRRRIAVKEYDEMLTDMNARQIANIAAEDVGAFNRVFREYRDTLNYFGYTLLDA